MAPVFANLEDVANQTFDYVVVGGGVAGSVLASRLSENSVIRVLLLEAGQGRINDPLIGIMFKNIESVLPAEHDAVDIPSGGPRGFQLGNPDYDWLFQTTPQKNLNGRSMTWNRGKGLGGSSNINQLSWLRPGPAEIDAWEKLGNPGWSYKDVLPYIQKAENFRTPSADIVKAKLLAEDQSWFGKTGPIALAYSEVLTGMDELLRTTVKNQGLSVINNAPLGEYIGFWSCPSTMDPEKLERCTAFKGYIQPNLERKNLFVLPEAYVTKLLWKDDSKPNSNEEITAEGVEFIFGGQTYVVYTAKEVLLTAGALKSPQILELSGIGSPDVLNPLGIPVLVDLPGVGENLQDHYCANTITFELSPTGSYRTLDVLFDPVEYAKQDELLYSISPNAEKIIASHEKELANRIASMDADSNVFKALKERLDIQLERLKNDRYPHFAIYTTPTFMDFPNMPDPGKMYLSVLIVLVGVWSTGSAVRIKPVVRNIAVGSLTPFPLPQHISSTDPLVSPNFDGNVLGYQFELDALTEAFKFTRQLKDCEPLKNFIVKEVAPGEKVVTDEQIHERIRATYGSIWHTNGTASMLPKEKGGVVDPNLKVYGTTNVRVCDLSIAPLQGNVNTQSTVYGIAEKAADIILGHGY